MKVQPYHVVLGCFLGWTTDAFDFFVIGDVARHMRTSITTMSRAVTLTLGLRVVGSLVFGRLADRYGRRPILMLNILAFSALGVRLRPDAHPCF